MARPRWSRFLPDRSQLILLGLVALLLFTLGGFVNLAIEKSAAQAELDSARGRLTASRHQEDMLRAGLDAAQRGQSVGPQAGDDFGLVQPGSSIVLPAQTSPTEASGAGAAGAPPYWAQWWERLTQP